MAEEFDSSGIEVWIGTDMAKVDHYVQALTADGTEIFHRPMLNDQAAIETVIDEAEKFGQPAFVIDMTSSIAQLLLTVAHMRSVPVAYVTGLQMRRAAQLYGGAAKTDPIDALVLADFARRNSDRLVWIDVCDELLIRLRILNGRDADLAADVTRIINRSRDALTAICPALERCTGSKFHIAGIRDLFIKWPTPTLLAGAGRARIRTALAKRSPRSATKYADQIWVALQSQTVTLPAEQTWGEVIADLLKDLETVLAKRKTLEASIEEPFLSHPLGKVLVSLCGFGTRTGSRTLAENW